MVYRPPIKTHQKIAIGTCITLVLIAMVIGISNLEWDVIWSGIPRALIIGSIITFIVWAIATTIFYWMGDIYGTEERAMEARKAAKEREENDV